ncbi:HlyD family secretion protein [Alkalinema pantanalense CENA528]|uniref:HlyD family secretion protein n=1 Tax=Alkalinema pantanalense TaxID=1620705 RepID=UPI003D6DD7C5
MSSSSLPKPDSTADEAALPPVAAQPQKSHRPNPRVLILGIAAIGVAGYFAWQAWGPKPEITAVVLSGRIESDETDIQAKNGGQVAEITVKEGDQVTSGQVLVKINADEVQAQVRRAGADVQSFQERVEQTRSDLASAQERVDRAQSRVQELDNRIREAGLNLEQSKGDASGQISQASAQVSVAQSQLSQAQAQVKQAVAELKLAQATRDRYAQLVTEGAINQQQYDQAQTALETARTAVEARKAGVTAAQDQLAAAQGGFTQAQTKGFNPGIRDAQLAALQEQRDQALADLRSAQADARSYQAKLKAAQADLQSTQARQKEAQANLAYSTLKSPITGVVLQRLVEPGAVVTPQKTILTLINPQEVYLRGYVPEGDVGRIAVGMKARVFLDSDGQRPIDAKVSAIDAKASFTPENIYFKKDRVRQVFGVRLTIEQSQGLAKPGMPADAEILLK